MTVRPAYVLGADGLGQQLQAGDQALIGAPARVTPVSGATVPLTAYHTLVDATAALSTLTLTLPGSPADGQRHYVTAIFAITVLTISGGTIKGGAPTTLLAAGTMGFLWSAAGAAWYRVQ